MATYTYTPTIYGKTSSKGKNKYSSTLAYTTTYSNARIGKTGSNGTSSYWWATGFQVDTQTPMSGKTVSKIEITITATTYNSYQLTCLKFGKKTTAGTTNTTISSSPVLTPTWASKTYSQTIDITSIGVSQYGYALGAYTTTGSDAYLQGITATIKVTTTDSTYTITYDAKGGSGAPTAQAVTDDNSTKSATLSDITPTRDGYVFKGWDSSSAGTTVVYSPGDSITLTSNKTIYAVWEPQETAALHYYNGSSIVDAKLYYFNGSSLVKCELYYFNGTSLVKCS